MKRLIQKQKRLRRRKLSIRNKMAGTAARPRLSVYKSNRHLYVQVIDDVAGHTLFGLKSGAGDASQLRSRVEDAARFGEMVGGKIKEIGVDTVVFDRNGNLYHGVIKSLADGVRKAGIRL